MDKRDKLIKQFMAKKGAFGPIGNASPGDRIRRAGGRTTEDSPGWNPKTMGNRRGREKGFTREYGKR